MDDSEDFGGIKVLSFSGQDPKNPMTFSHRKAKLRTGKSYHFVDEMPHNYNEATTQTILCLHGFPDSWYGYRWQIGPWARRGYRVIVPDMLGYGDTDAPVESEHYSTKSLCSDLAALLDHCGVRKVIVVGHDWGSHCASRFALWYPKRISALVLISLPYTPPAPVYVPVEEIVQRYPNMGYQLYFTEDQAIKDINGNLKSFLKIIFSSGGGHGFTEYGEMQKDLLDQSFDPGNRCLLNGSELEYYFFEFQKNGILGPLSYYRTGKQRFDEEKAAKLKDIRSDLPVLYIGGRHDPTLATKVVQRSRKFVPLLEMLELDGGHWLLIESKSKDAVTKKVLDWLPCALKQDPPSKL